MHTEPTPHALRTRVRALLDRWLSPLLHHGGWSLVWGVFLAVALVVWVRPWLQSPDVYPEPTAGHDTWKGGSKAGDFRAVYLLLLAGAALSAASAWTVARAAGNGDGAERRRRAAHTVLLVASLPAIAWLSRLLLQKDAHPAAPLTAALWIVVGHVALWIVGSLRDALDETRLRVAALTILGAAFVAHFCGAAAALVPVRLAPRIAIGGVAVGIVGWAAVVAVLGICATLGQRARGDVARFERGLQRVALACQLPLALLPLCLYPTFFKTPFGGPRNEAHWPLAGVAVACTLLTLFGWSRTWRAMRRATAAHAAPGAGGGPPWQGCWSPLPLAAIAVFLAAQNWGVPVLPEDDWHFGERWTSWQQWVQFAKVPYIDTMPTFGMYGPIVGVLERMFFDPTVAGWLSAEVLLRVLLAGATCLVAGAVGGPGAALFVAMWPAFTDRLAMIAPCVLLLAWPALLARPAVWLLCWPACCLLAAAFNPASGVALALASAPIAFWLVWRHRARERSAPDAAATAAHAQGRTPWRSPLLRPAFAWLAMALIVVVATPALRMARGFLDYIRSNGLLYSIHAGIAQSLVFEADRLATDVMTTAGARHIWLAGWIAIAVLLARTLAVELQSARAPGLRPDPSRAALAGMALGVTLLLIPWTVTRIDSNGWSRAGAMTFTWLAVLLPPLIARSRRAAMLPAAMAVLTALLSPFLLPHPAQSTSSAFEHAGVPRQPQGEQTLVDGDQIGLPALGTVAVEDRKHLALLQDMRRLVEANTKPGDPMFDLANRPALYGYTGRPMAARYASGYYLGNDRLQRQVLDDLRRTPPKAVFFGPAIVHGEGPSTVRSYRVAKYLLLNYRPVERGDAVLLVPGPAPSGELTEQEQREQMLRLSTLDRVVGAAGSSYAVQDLGLVPATWGRSWGSMAGFFQPPDSVKVIGDAEQNDPTWWLYFGAQVVAGRDVDFLKLELEWTSTAATAREAGMKSTTEPPPTIDIVWSNNGREIPRPLRIALSEPLATRLPRGASALMRSTLLVPVGSHPRWLLSPAVENVMVKPTTPGLLPVFSVVSVEALRLKD